MDRPSPNAVRCKVLEQIRLDLLDNQNTNLVLVGYVVQTPLGKFRERLGTGAGCQTRRSRRFRSPSCPAFSEACADATKIFRSSCERFVKDRHECDSGPDLDAFVEATRLRDPQFGR
jgi:hypothetical protein